jgi:xylulose-5-phosphate/fructose-6-phosphate phosphoketolase
VAQADRLAELPADLPRLAQDHNGFSHQDPGLHRPRRQQEGRRGRIYLPPDANCLLSVADHCLRSRNYINLIVAGKQPEWQWLDIDAAVRHCTAGAGVWDWASNDGDDPDVVMACAGDVPTLETLAAVTLLRDYVPDIRIRVVNVVDLMVLQPQSSIRTAWRTRISTRCSRPTSR